MWNAIGDFSVAARAESHIAADADLLKPAPHDRDASAALQPLSDSVAKPHEKPPHDPSFSSGAKHVDANGSTITATSPSPPLHALFAKLGATYRPPSDALPSAEARVPTHTTRDIYRTELRYAGDDENWRLTVYFGSELAGGVAGAGVAGPHHHEYVRRVRDPRTRREEWYNQLSAGDRLVVETCTTLGAHRVISKTYAPFRADPRFDEAAYAGRNRRFTGRTKTPLRERVATVQYYYGVPSVLLRAYVGSQIDERAQSQDGTKNSVEHVHTRMPYTELVRPDREAPQTTTLMLADCYWQAVARTGRLLADPARRFESGSASGGGGGGAPSVATNRSGKDDGGKNDTNVDELRHDEQKDGECGRAREFPIDPRSDTTYAHVISREHTTYRDSESDAADSDSDDPEAKLRESRDAKVAVGRERLQSGHASDCAVCADRVARASAVHGLTLDLLVLLHREHREHSAAAVVTRRAFSDVWRASGRRVHRVEWAATDDTIVLSRRVLGTRPADADADANVPCFSPRVSSLPSASLQYSIVLWDAKLSATVDGDGSVSSVVAARDVINFSVVPTVASSSSSSSPPHASLNVYESTLSTDGATFLVARKTIFDRRGETAFRGRVHYSQGAMHLPEIERPRHFSAFVRPAAGSTVAVTDATDQGDAPVARAKVVADDQPSRESARLFLVSEVIAKVDGDGSGDDGSAKDAVSDEKSEDDDDDDDDENLRLDAAAESKRGDACHAKNSVVKRRQRRGGGAESDSDVDCDEKKALDSDRVAFMFCVDGRYRRNRSRYARHFPSSSVGHTVKRIGADVARRHPYFSWRNPEHAAAFVCTDAFGVALGAVHQEPRCLWLPPLLCGTDPEAAAALDVDASEWLARRPTGRCHSKRFVFSESLERKIDDLAVGGEPNVPGVHDVYSASADITGAAAARVSSATPVDPEDALDSRGPRDTLLCGTELRAFDRAVRRHLAAVGRRHQKATQTATSTSVRYRLFGRDCTYTTHTLAVAGTRDDHAADAERNGATVAGGDGAGGGDGDDDGYRWRHPLVALRRVQYNGVDARVETRLGVCEVGADEVDANGHPLADEFSRIVSVRMCGQAMPPADGDGARETKDGADRVIATLDGGPETTSVWIGRKPVPPPDVRPRPAPVTPVRVSAYRGARRIATEIERRSKTLRAARRHQQQQQQQQQQQSRIVARADQESKRAGAAVAADTADSVAERNLECALEIWRTVSADEREWLAKVVQPLARDSAAAAAAAAPLTDLEMAELRLALAPRAVVVQADDAGAAAAANRVAAVGDVGAASALEQLWRALRRKLASGEPMLAFDTLAVGTARFCGAELARLVDKIARLERRNAASSGGTNRRPGVATFATVIDLAAALLRWTASTVVGYQMFPCPSTCAETGACTLCIYPSDASFDRTRSDDGAVAMAATATATAAATAMATSAEPIGPDFRATDAASAAAPDGSSKRPKKSTSHVDAERQRAATRRRTVRKKWLDATRGSDVMRHAAEEMTRVGERDARRTVTRNLVACVDRDLRRLARTLHLHGYTSSADASMPTPLALFAWIGARLATRRNVAAVETANDGFGGGGGDDSAPWQQYNAAPEQLADTQKWVRAPFTVLGPLRGRWSIAFSTPEVATAKGWFERLGQFVSRSAAKKSDGDSSAGGGTAQGFSLRRHDDSGRERDGGDSNAGPVAAIGGEDASGKQTGDGKTRLVYHKLVLGSNGMECAVEIEWLPLTEREQQADDERRRLKAAAAAATSATSGTDSKEQKTAKVSRRGRARTQSAKAKSKPASNSGGGGGALTHDSVAPGVHNKRRIRRGRVLSVVPVVMQDDRMMYAHEYENKTECGTCMDATASTVQDCRCRMPVCTKCSPNLMQREMRCSRCKTLVSRVTILDARVHAEYSAELAMRSVRWRMEAEKARAGISSSSSSSPSSPPPVVSVPASPSSVPARSDRLALTLSSVSLLSPFAPEFVPTELETEPEQKLYPDLGAAAPPPPPARTEPPPPPPPPSDRDEKKRVPERDALGNAEQHRKHTLRWGASAIDSDRWLYYVVGEIVEEPDFDPSDLACSDGVHVVPHFSDLAQFWENFPSGIPPKLRVLVPRPPPPESAGPPPPSPSPPPASQPPLPLGPESVDLVVAAAVAATTTIDTTSLVPCDPASWAAPFAPSAVSADIVRPSGWQPMQPSAPPMLDTVFARPIAAPTLPAAAPRDSVSTTAPPDSSSPSFASLAPPSSHEAPAKRVDLRPVPPPGPPPSSRGVAATAVASGTERRATGPIQFGPRTRDAPPSSASRRGLASIASTSAFSANVLLLPDIASSSVAASASGFSSSSSSSLPPHPVPTLLPPLRSPPSVSTTTPLTSIRSASTAPAKISAAPPPRRNPTPPLLTPIVLTGPVGQPHDESTSSAAASAAAAAAVDQDEKSLGAPLLLASFSADPSSSSAATDDTAPLLRDTDPQKSDAAPTTRRRRALVRL